MLESSYKKIYNVVCGNFFFFCTDFYTAWDVIAKNVLGNMVDPGIANR